MHRDEIVRTLFAQRATLLAYCWAIVHDDHMGEDLFQDMVLAAMNRDDPFEHSDHLLAWARLTLRNKSLHELRQRHSHASTLSGDVFDLIESEWDEHKPVDASEIVEALRECLAQLTPHARQLIELRYGESLTGRQVAEQLDRQPHAVYTALSRAYKALAECVNSRLESNGQAHHV